MTSFRFNSSILSNLINENKDIILDQFKSSPLETEKIKIVISKYLNPLYEEIDNKNDTFILLLPQDQIKDITFDKNYSEFRNDILSILKCGYNKIIIDAQFNITSKSSKTYPSSHEAFNDYRNLSYTNYLFYFGEKLDTFFNGETEHFNTFYCDADIQRYAEKYTIEELETVLKKYTDSCISQQNEYSRFFEHKSIIDKLINKDSYYVLKNKPEKFMRDHLRTYLNEKMQARFQIEVELPVSKRKLDLYTEVNGKFYFLEIKWLGVSISDDLTELGTSYSDSRARNGVTQTLQYIKELKESTTNNLQCGHLVIFDARKKKSKIDYKDFSFLPQELHKFRIYFNIYDKISLNNSHPC